MTASELPSVSGIDKLKGIADNLTNEQSAEPVTVRQLLSWFDAQRRGAYIVEEIREALHNAGLSTAPDFVTTYIDNQIQFVPAKPSQPAEQPSEIEKAAEAMAGAYQIGRLELAHKSPVYVPPNCTITGAITLMMTNDFSQLPVMTGEREVKGIVSWMSVGRDLAMGAKCNEVRECMDRAHVISDDTSLFDAITEIVNNQYVLIEDRTKKICGIVTTSDLSLCRATRHSVMFCERVASGAQLRPRVGSLVMTCPLSGTGVKQSLRPKAVAVSSVSLMVKVRGGV